MIEEHPNDKLKRYEELIAHLQEQHFKLMEIVKLQQAQIEKNIQADISGENFIRAFNSMAWIVYRNAEDHGFWHQGDARSKPEMIALMHSELSEALEGYRHGDPPDKHCPEFTSVEVELADTIIRIMDFAKGFDMRVGAAIVAKHQYNLTRGIMHGWKRC